MKPSKKQSVAGILVRDSLIFVGLRLPQGKMGGKWEFPGGKVEKGETCEQALIREFKEEFETDIEVGKQIASAEFTHKQENIDLLAFRVYAKNDQWILREHTEVRWVSIEDIGHLDFVDSDLLLLDQLKKELS